MFNSPDIIPPSAMKAFPLALLLAFGPLVPLLPFFEPFGPFVPPLPLPDFLDLLVFLEPFPPFPLPVGATVPVTETLSAITVVGNEEGAADTDSDTDSDTDNDAVPDPDPVPASGVAVPVAVPVLVPVWAPACALKRSNATIAVICSACVMVRYSYQLLSSGLALTKRPHFYLGEYLNLFASIKF